MGVWIVVRAGMNPAPSTGVWIVVRAGMNPAPTVDIWIVVRAGMNSDPTVNGSNHCRGGVHPLPPSPSNPIPPIRPRPRPGPPVLRRFRDNPRPHRVAEDISCHVYKPLPVPGRMVVKSALPEPAVGIDAARARRQAPLENTDITGQIGILQQEMHVVRHDTPGVQRGLAGVGEPDNYCGGIVCQGWMQGEPGVTVVRADRDEKHPSRGMVRGRIKADSFAVRGDGCRRAPGHGRM